MHFIFSLLFTVIKKLVMFTGIHIPLIALVIYVWVGDRSQPMIGGEKLTNVIVAASLLAVPFYLLRNIIRLVTHSDFKYSDIFRRIGHKERRHTSPPAPSILQAAKPEGFIFGKKGLFWIRKPTNLDGHIFVVGGAGSGKSSCIAIPSLMSWNDRVFAIDIKGELSQKTISRRPASLVFNPYDRNAPGYDPFALLEGSDNKTQDIREIAIILVPMPENTKDPFWIASAQNYLTGALLHFYSQRYGFIDCIKLIQSIPAMQLVEDITQNGNQDARLYINQFVGMDTKTLAGIVSELSNHIMLFATDTDIQDALSRSFRIAPEELERGQDIYIVIPEYRLDQWRSLLTLIVDQFLKHFERRPDMGAVPVLFLLDEFPRLGKVKTVVNGLATLRSKKVSIALFAQSLAQLDMIYGADARKVIVDNCQYKAILSATDADTQDYFSRLVGTYDRTKKSSNANFDPYTGMGTGTGSGTTTEEKRIIKPESFATLQDIILLSPFGYFRVDKTPYYKTREFS